jgi:protein SCO1/2
MLVYFGYTYCPDICPLGLQTMTEAVHELPDEVARQVVPLFITVDPERDTLPVMTEYVGLFDDGLIGLTGTPAEIGAVTKAYRVYARKADSSTAADYLMDHSTFTYLMGPDGEYVTHFGHGTTPEQMAARIAELVRSDA